MGPDWIERLRCHPCDLRRAPLRWSPVGSREGHHASWMVHLGTSQAQLLARVYATQHPGCVDKLILHGYARMATAGRRPAADRGQAHLFLTMRQGWGDEHSVFVKLF